MGSGHSKSSQVHSFHAEQQNEEIRNTREQDIKKIGSSPEGENQELNEGFVPKLTEKETLVGAQEKIKLLEKQLGEAESENLDLQDRIQALEGQLEYVGTLQTVTEEPEDLTETIKAKDKFIETLQKEKEASQTEFNKMKGRYRKRIRLLTTQVSEAKQETSIQMFELRDEITRLREENNKMHGKQGDKGTSNNGLQDFEKMKIVLELSNQVSEQSEQIEKLEREVTEKKRIIDKLMSTKSPIHEHKENTSLPTHTDDDVLLAELKQRDENVALKKLSFGLSQYKNGSLIEDEEERVFSGASRDSGIGFADKHSRKNVQIPDSKLLVLSDSDWESDEPSFQSKIRSAPPDSKSKRTTPRGGGSASSSRTLQNNESDEDLRSLGDISTTSKPKRSAKKSFLQKRFHVDTKDRFFLTQTSTTPINGM